MLTWIKEDTITVRRLLEILISINEGTLEIGKVKDRESELAKILDSKIYVMDGELYAKINE